MPATSTASVVAAANASPLAWNIATYTPALDSHELYAMQGVEVKLHPLLAFEDDQLMLRYDMTTGTTQLFVANTHGEADFSPFANAPATLPRLKELILVTKASPWVTQVQNDKGVTLSDILTQLYHDYVGIPITEAEVAAMGRGEWAQLHRRVGRHSPRNSAENYFASTGMTPPTGIYGARHLPGGSPYGAYPGLPAGYTQPGYGPPVPPGYGPSGGSPYGPPSLLIGINPPAATASVHHSPGFSLTGGSPGASGAPSPATRPSSLGAMRKDWLLDRRIFNGLSRDAAYCEARLGFNAPNAFFLDLIR